VPAVPSVFSRGKLKIKIEFVYSNKLRNMSEQEFWKKYNWDGKFHPEIENAVTIPYEQKENLQFMLETNFNNDFEELIKDILQYSIVVEDYESAVEIRDYLEDKEESEN
jgi:hypothetical protein